MSRNDLLETPGFTYFYTFSRVTETISGLLDCQATINCYSPIDSASAFTVFVVFCPDNKCLLASLLSASAISTIPALPGTSGFCAIKGSESNDELRFHLLEVRDSQCIENLAVRCVLRRAISKVG